VSIVLVVNSGSSSFKYQLLDMDHEHVLATGLVERIGQPVGVCRHTVHGPYAAPGTAIPTVLDATSERELPIPDHFAGFAAMLDAFARSGPSLAENPPVAVGHRVVHGGARFFEPTLITPLVEINIEDLAVLAPLHNPANLAGIVAARRAFGDIPHVAVFDTAFHQTLSAPAYTYAIDAELAAHHRIRRYGFHGTSHKFVSQAAAAFLDRPTTQLKQIIFHLGNGASVTAVDGGRSVETSMGFTPLEGLVMGTRSGDIDPAVLFQLARRAALDVEQLDDLLNKRSGLKGLTGFSDMRDVLAGRARGEAAASLAFDVYVHRLRAYAGAYIAQGLEVVKQLGGWDKAIALSRDHFQVQQERHAASTTPPAGGAPVTQRAGR